MNSQTVNSYPFARNQTSSKRQKLLAAAPVATAWVFGVLLTISLSGCVSSKKEEKKQPQLNECAPNYSPLGLDLPAPAKAVRFTDIIKNGTLRLNHAEYFTDLKVGPGKPIKFHFSEDRTTKGLKAICESAVEPGTVVNEIEYFVPAYATQNARGDITTEARKYTFELDGKFLRMAAQNDDRLGRLMSPDDIINYNHMWNSYRLYELSPTSYELHLEQNLSLGADFARTTRMVVQYDLIP